MMNNCQQAVIGNAASLLKAKIVTGKCVPLNIENQQTEKRHYPYCRNVMGECQ
jgi:hypothetical protein